jgi:diacylglycerol kinase
LPGDNYFKLRLRSIKIALSGIWQVIITQQNARIHLAATLVVLIASILLGFSRMEWMILLLTVGFVWAAEIFNTAIEDLVDLISPENTPAAKRIKDISAGAVLVSALVSVLVGLLLFGTRIWAWIAG